MDEPSEAGVQRRWGLEVAALVTCWVPFGFLHGLHWFVISCRISANGTKQRRAAVTHLLSYWLGLLGTALGGGWCRGAQTVECPEGEVMSSTCLWDAYSTTYQTIYVAHYVCLAWNVAHWLLDGPQLLHWGRQLQRGELLSFCCSSVPVQMFNYTIVILVAVVLVTLSWTVIIDWSTADGLGTLALVLVLVIVVVGLLECLVLKLSGCFFAFARNQGMRVMCPNFATAMQHFSEEG